jgi:hypothetical protein
MMMVSGECLAYGRLQTLMVVCTSIRLSAFAERHRQLSNVTGVLDFPGEQCAITARTSAIIGD